MTDESMLSGSARLRLFDLVGTNHYPNYTGDITWFEFKKFNADGFNEGDFSQIEIDLAVDKIVVRNEGAGRGWMAVLLD
jgi:hypothetical protein